MTDQLKQLSEAAEVGPWEYRPRKHDDWGIIRGGKEVFEDEESGPPVASTRPIWNDYDFDAHRAAGTDPMAPNGQFIVALVNAYRAGELVPAEEARAQVAVAYEVAAGRCKIAGVDEFAPLTRSRDEAFSACAGHLEREIRALTPDHTTTALEQIKADADKAGFERAKAMAIRAIEPHRKADVKTGGVLRIAQQAIATLSADTQENSDE